MADESRDVSGHEQLSIVVRSISDKVVPSRNHDRSHKYPTIFNEYFISLVKLDQFDAQTLTDEIVQCLTSSKIDLNKCVSICFDGYAETISIVKDLASKPTLGCVSLLPF
jgi:Domain of unknown function (DUF4371)